MSNDEKENLKGEDASPSAAHGCAHLHVAFSERPDGDCSRCTTCGGKTMLISPFSEWKVDSEPFQTEETVDEIEEELPETVEVVDEITAHWCDDCRKITSLSFSSRA